MSFGRNSFESGVYRVRSPAIARQVGNTMSTPDSSSPNATLEECIDELNDFVLGAERFSSDVLAMAMRTHLAALLRALLEHGECSREEAATFIAELGREVLEEAQADPPS
jgi:hypothetical protein